MGIYEHECNANSVNGCLTRNVTNNLAMLSELGRLRGLSEKFVDTYD